MSRRAYPLLPRRLFMQLRYAAERLGPGRWPAAADLLDRLDRLVFEPVWRDEELLVRERGVILRIPAESVPGYARRRWEPLTTRALLRHLPRGGRFVDVGGHIGHFAAFAARRVGVSGRVHVVEPAPDNVRLLEAMVTLNGFSQISIHAVAAGRASGMRALQMMDHGDSHGFYPHPLATRTASLNVPVHRLDELVEPPVDVIKVDVEGAELDVLEGATGLLAADPPPVLVVEWNPASQESAGRDPLELPAALERAGFESIEAIDERGFRTVSLEDARRLHEAGDLDGGRYVNLLARPEPRP
ncbi:MAG: FkbM family methyltransferase [Gemmatimonadetes bacterium]|nr:FkbM family methyltransferase [Gemmatimonadota bacterium]